jgi:hypothetical protein
MVVKLYTLHSYQLHPLMGREGAGDDRGLGKVENPMAPPLGLLLITISCVV